MLSANPNPLVYIYININAEFAEDSQIQIRSSCSVGWPLYSCNNTCLERLGGTASHLQLQQWSGSIMLLRIRQAIGREEVYFHENLILAKNLSWRSPLGNQSSFHSSKAHSVQTIGVQIFAVNCFIPMGVQIFADRQCRH
jgi:hypothetical protein